MGLFFPPLQEHMQEVHHTIASQEMNPNESITLRPSNNLSYNLAHKRVWVGC
jgi:hypothetical protein